MTITVQADPERTRFEAVDESGVVAGFAEYVEHRGNRVLGHTEVDDAFEGEGVGSTLARQAIDQTLDAGFGVIVTCPFIRAWVHKHPDYQDKVTLP